MHNKPFLAARLRLAISFSGVMSVILIVCSLAIFRLITHARWLSLNQQMEQMAILVERHIKPAFREAGQFGPEAAQYIPGLCQIETPCEPISQLSNLDASDRAIELIEHLIEDGYCVRFLNLDRQPIAIVQMPEPHDFCNDADFWNELVNFYGEEYRPVAYPLYTLYQQKWGYLHLAKSTDALDINLFWIEISLLGLSILATLTIGAASWWLSGLALQPVRQSYQQMQQFTADAAHELRTPLAALRTTAQVALRAETLEPQDVQTTLQTINRQSQRLSKLVQDLLLLCQTEQATFQEFQPCHLDAVLNELKDDFMAMALAKELKLSVEIENPGSIYVLGNREQLYRAIANLLNNAIHYTHEGGLVWLRLYSRSRAAIIQVQDTGIGIAPDDQALVFNRFYRVERARSQQRGGTGLGLAIAQSIVHQHRGTITLESTLGKGSLFTIQLPLIYHPN